MKRSQKWRFVVCLIDSFLEEKGSTTNGIDKDNKNSESDEHKENFDKPPN